MVAAPVGKLLCFCAHKHCHSVKCLFSSKSSGVIIYTGEINSSTAEMSKRQLSYWLIPIKILLAAGMMDNVSCFPPQSFFEWFLNRLNIDFYLHANATYTYKVIRFFFLMSFKDRFRSFKSKISWQFCSIWKCEGAIQKCYSDFWSR